MHIGTNTNLISFNRDGSKSEMDTLIPRYAQGGFTALDLNFCELLNPKSQLRDNTDAYIATLKQLRSRHSLTYHQAHAPYANDDLTLHPLLGKAMACAHELSIPILVVHPLPLDVEDNRRAWAPIIKEAETLALTIAFENLSHANELTEISDLVALVDELDSPNAAICWDTGHAHLCGHDLVQDIALMGHRLKATHIADNDGRADEHRLPFFGTIKWEAVIAALVQSGWRGTLTLECMFFTRYLPSPLKGAAIAMAKACAEQLLATLGQNDSAP